MANEKSDRLLIVLMKVFSLLFFLQKLYNKSFNMKIIYEIFSYKKSLVWDFIKQVKGEMQNILVGILCKKFLEKV